MADSLFTVNNGTYTPTELSRGPWSDDALHGGPVAALLAHELTAVPTEAAMFPARLTVELWRPVTFTQLRVETDVVRPGRKVQVIDARLLDGDKVLGRASLQQIVASPVPLPDEVDDASPVDVGPPPPEAVARSTTTAQGLSNEGIRFHSDAVEHRSIEPLFTAPGPNTDWIHVRADLVPGKPLSPVERVAAAADFGNGISGIVPWDGFVFVNTDLTIHLFRLPVDEWVCLDAVTRIDAGPEAGSVGLAESALYDRHGRIGRSLQSLLVATR